MCTDCPRDLNRYDPACLGCGQRYIRDVKARRMELEEKQGWLRAILKTWMEFGHAESALRASPCAPGSASPAESHSPPPGRRKSSAARTAR
jgi:hypothetical protein